MNNFDKLDELADAISKDVDSQHIDAINQIKKSNFKNKDKMLLLLNQLLRGAKNGNKVDVMSVIKQYKILADAG